MLKRLTRKLFILSALVAYLTLAVPSISAQGSGYQISGYIYYSVNGNLIRPTVGIEKWNGSSWEPHGSASADSCGFYTYDTGGPGTFRGWVPTSMYGVSDSCGWVSTYAWAGGFSFGVEVTTAQPFQWMDIFTSSGCCW